MTDQNVTDDQTVCVPRYAFEALAAFVPLGEDSVGVMLLLLMRMDSNRAVKIDIHLLPRFFTIRRDRLEYALSLVIKYGWVQEVDEKAMQDGWLICVVHPAFLHSDYKSLKLVLSGNRLFGDCVR
ncbi:hypothetical protein [Pseudomonas putida]